MEQEIWEGLQRCLGLLIFQIEKGDSENLSEETESVMDVFSS
jgi:hypothetical protein